MENMDAAIFIQKMMNFYNVSTITELAKKLEMSQPAVTNWQRRNSINAIKKKCRELGIYSEIFGDINTNINEPKDSKENQIELLVNDLSKYFIALESVAVATNKEDELIDDIKELMKKYIG